MTSILGRIVFNYNYPINNYLANVLAKISIKRERDIHKITLKERQFH